MEHWSNHARYYDLFQNAYSKYHAMIAFHVTELRNYSNILDSGAGTGNLTLQLLKEGHFVTSIDNNDNSLKILKEKYKKDDEKLQVIKADLNNTLNFPNNSFDGVASSLVVPFVNNLNVYFGEIYRVLKKDGKFTLSMALPKEGAMDYIMSHLEKDSRREGILPTYEKEWGEINKTSRMNEQIILKENIDADKVISALKKIGFRDIKTHKDPYDGFLLFLTSLK